MDKIIRNGKRTKRIRAYTKKQRCKKLPTVEITKIGYAG